MVAGDGERHRLGSDARRRCRRSDGGTWRGEGRQLSAVSTGTERTDRRSYGSPVPGRRRDWRRVVSDDDALGLFGAFVLLGLAVWSGIWWLILPAALVAIACVMACLPAHVGGAPVYRREPEALDEIADRLREVHRSLDAD